MFNDQSPNRSIDDQEQYIADIINLIPYPLEDLSMTLSSNSSTPCNLEQRYHIEKNNRQSNSPSSNQFNQQNRDNFNQNYLPQFSNNTSMNYEQNYQPSQNFQDEINQQDGDLLNTRQDYEQKNYYLQQHQVDYSDNDLQKYLPISKNYLSLQSNRFSSMANNNNNQDQIPNIFQKTLLFPEIPPPSLPELSNENSFFSQQESQMQQPSYLDIIDKFEKTLIQLEQQKPEESVLKKNLYQKIDENQVDDSSYKQLNQKGWNDRDMNGNSYDQDKNAIGNYKNIWQDNCEQTQDTHFFQYQQQKQPNNKNKSNYQSAMKFYDFYDQESYSNFCQSTKEQNNYQEVRKLQSLLQDKEKLITDLQQENAQLYERINEFEEKFSLHSEKFNVSTSSQLSLQEVNYPNQNDHNDGCGYNRSQDSIMSDIEFMESNNNTLNQSQNNSFNQKKSDVVLIGNSNISDLMKQGLQDFNILSEFNLNFNDTGDNQDSHILISFIKQVANKINFSSQVEIIQ